MSHIHFPDGILPAWLWGAGYALTILLLMVLWQVGRVKVPSRKFALLGIFAALMILIMTFEIPVISYHVNFSVITGIILGPRLGLLAALIVNSMLALIGHGGVTVIGLNTLTLWVEMFVGYGVFRLVSLFLPRIRWAGFLATVIGLAVGTGASYGIIFLGSPWINHALQTATLYPGEELGPAVDGVHIDLTRLAILMFGLGAVGWGVEGWLSSVVLGYLGRLYPGIFGDRK